jgi:lysophospholipase L1-like esterase
MNLGFCGRAWCEPAVANALGRVDAALYIVDPLPNNTVDQLKERLPEFLRILRARRPDTPILLVQDRLHGDASFVAGRDEIRTTKNAALDDVIAALRDAGMAGLHVASHPSWYGNDFEGTTDGSHPNSIGAHHMAHAMEPIVSKLLPVENLAKGPA